MNKEDIFLIQKILITDIIPNNKREEILKLSRKIDLIVEQINAQDKIQDIQKQLQELEEK